jgi:NADH dehydrogenase
MDFSSVRPRVLVLGGTGFIGRHVVSALHAQGCGIVIGSRAPHRYRHRQSANDWRELHVERLLQPGDWEAVLVDVDAVVNCVGILRPRGSETYDRVHHRAPGALALACRERGLRLVHVSALGLEEGVRTRFLRSKRDGERALRASGADWHIVRPSLLDGEGGFGARWIRRVAAWPVHPLPRGAVGKLAVLDVRDLGEAIANLVLDPFPLRREHDLGGPHARTLGQHLAALRVVRHRAPAVRLHLPDAATRLLAHACDLLHATPLSFGHWELLRHDNLPAVNHLPGLLGRAPRAVGLDQGPACIAPPALPLLGRAT